MLRETLTPTTPHPLPLVSPHFPLLSSLLPFPNRISFPHLLFFSPNHLPFFLFPHLLPFFPLTLFHFLFLLHLSFPHFSNFSLIFPSSFSQCSSPSHSFPLIFFPSLFSNHSSSSPHFPFFPLTFFPSSLSHSSSFLFSLPFPIPPPFHHFIFFSLILLFLSLSPFSSFFLLPFLTVSFPSLYYLSAFSLTSPFPPFLSFSLSLFLSLSIFCSSLSTSIYRYYANYLLSRLFSFLLSSSFLVFLHLFLPHPSPFHSSIYSPIYLLYLSFLSFFFLHVLFSLIFSYTNLFHRYFFPSVNEIIFSPITFFPNKERQIRDNFLSQLPGLLFVTCKLYDLFLPVLPRLFVL